MNGIALLLLLAVVEAPPWQIEIDETVSNAIWKIHIDHQLLEQWATAGKNRVAHTTRIELPATAQSTAERFQIRFGNKPLGSDWISLAMDADELTMHPQVHPSGCQTEIRLHPALTRRLKLGGYQIHGRLPPGQHLQKQLLIQITAADNRGAAPIAFPRPGAAAAAPDATIATELKAVIRTSPAFAEPPRGTVKDWPPRARSSKSLSGASVANLADSTVEPEPISATENAGPNLNTARPDPRQLDHPAARNRLDNTVNQGSSPVLPVPANDHRAAEPTDSQSGSGNQRESGNRRETVTASASEVRPATYLMEPAAVGTERPAPEKAPAPFAASDQRLPTPTAGAAQAVPPRQVPSDSSTAGTTGAQEVNRQQPPIGDRVRSKPPTQWLILVLGLFASLGLNVFLVINHRTIAAQYRQLVSRTYGRGPNERGPNGRGQQQLAAVPSAAETGPAGLLRHASDGDSHHENESGAQTANGVDNQEEQAVVHRRKE